MNRRIIQVTIFMTTKALDYKGYLGSIEVSIEDNCLHGKLLGISDVIGYEGQTIKELTKAFMEAVEDYIEVCVKNAVKKCR